MNVGAVFKNVGKAVVKHLPDILIGLGIVTGTAGMIVVAKEGKTYAKDERIQKAQEDLEAVRATTYETKAQRASALTKAHLKTAGAKIRHYAPAIGLEAASIGLILSGSGIGNDRLAKAVASGSAAALSYKNYRENVVKELGEEADFNFASGITDQTVDIPELDKNGNPKLDKEGNKKTKRGTVSVKTGKSGMYNFIFGPMSSTQWVDDPVYLATWLQSKEDEWNGKFLREKYKKNPKPFFLNPILEDLGLETVDYGQIDGWRHDPDNPDKRISFGLKEAYTPQGDLTGNDFGFETTYILSFNCDGPVIGWM